MKIKHPKIYVISRPNLDEIELEKFLIDNKLSWKKDELSRPGEQVVEISGRVCYMSFTDDIAKIRFPNRKYIENLIARGHESVLEHASWTFILDGVSRSFTHQLVRHRVGFSYSQLSQQYHDESEAEMILPNGLDKSHPAYAAWEHAVDGVLVAYRSLVGMIVDGGPDDTRERLRWIRSVARSLLPNATSTTIAITANARALRHFLSLRGSLEGDYEMREISALLLKTVASDAPALFSDFEVVMHEDGREIVVKNM
ncbi:MAG: thymidylate synthase (FAD) [Hoeflea sp.]|uniref:FAD-dependent thymidylate synthase n=1 Tax=Hoeflea sp. TaxID=1940281 RepID=UPI000C0F51F4|nr:FAD-dependent thymidylate synthase [Hoeflea sp.]PHR24801.1 MAG: thymidylate synthase (FAD) [Hoeflea sp.]